MLRRPTIADVAVAAGVSKGLVSLALNDRPGVAAETKDRIRQAAESIGWRANASARGLSNRRAYALGLVVRRDPRIIEADPFFPAFIAGIEAALAHKAQVLVLTVVPDAEAEQEAYRMLAGDNRVDGFFLTDLLKDDYRIALVEELGVWAVTLGIPDIRSPFPAISRDYDTGIAELTSYLISLGHQRIAHVAGDERMLHGMHRRDQYSAVMRQEGFDPVVVPTDFSAEQGAEATRYLLDLHERPTAIIFANDPMAIAGMSVAQERGLKLPTDLSISGMDGSEIGKYVFPSLTTLKNDPAEWGRTASLTLLKLIDDGEAPNAELPAAELVIRGSTAPAVHPAENIKA
ncbi:LacI family transcriptional regulator [Arthrobacter sp. ERGS1:01]|uniref:LacI family DNA-binding transcriptional regulator n=1 Tax=Arthrobacter sp. ERGS1:01 TaxID=1704044 RepID=UPI0006B543D7|nr:LacI family DNA-binding transcriptional regulator [Arthrobacter sp. ERGS1:01]ALE05699.1 LacI family transcriptional regulator [Arthrobacter sp. ERGS1:01]